MDDIPIIISPMAQQEVIEVVRPASTLALLVESDEETDSH